MRDAPHGELEFEHPPPDVERRRRFEIAALETGSKKSIAAALTEDGEMAGFHELIVFPDFRMATIGNTGVPAKFRGHGLGLRLKAAMTLHLLEREPHVEVISTWNNADNAPMVAGERGHGLRGLRDLERLAVRPLMSIEVRELGVGHPDALSVVLPLFQAGNAADAPLHPTPAEPFVKWLITPLAVRHRVLAVAYDGERALGYGLMQHDNDTNRATIHTDIWIRPEDRAEVTVPLLDAYRAHARAARLLPRNPGGQRARRRL